MIKKYIVDFLTENKIIKDPQHGFMKGRSCLSNLLICQDSIVSMIDDGLPVDIFYLDFQKALDKVPHGRLLEKIRETGIDGKITDWIAKWL